MSYANSSFDKVAATTLKNYQKQLADNISNHIPLLKYMKNKGSMVVNGCWDFMGGLMKYRVIKEFTDHDGVVHPAGELADAYTNATYGALEYTEIPLVFNNKTAFMGVDESFVEEVL